MEEQEQRFSEPVAPGLAVYWCKGSQVNPNQRQLALVLESNNQGVLTLGLMPKLGGGPIERVQSCYHVSRQDSLTDVNGVPNNNALKHGCWDFTDASKFLHEMIASTVSEEDLEDAACLDELVAEIVSPDIARLAERIQALEEKCSKCDKPAAKRSPKKKADES